MTGSARKRPRRLDNKGSQAIFGGLDGWAREKWVGFTLVALHCKATKANPTHFCAQPSRPRQKLVWEPLFSQPEAFLLGLGTNGPLS